MKAEVKDGAVWVRLDSEEETLNLIRTIAMSGGRTFGISIGETKKPMKARVVKKREVKK